MITIMLLPRLKEFRQVAITMLSSLTLRQSMYFFFLRCLLTDDMRNEKYLTR